MEKPVKDRRRMSRTGLLESAIRTACELAAGHDLKTRYLANRLLADLQQLQRDMPMRRQSDVKSRGG